MSVLAVERNAWRALFAAQVGWMLDAMDFLLFTFAIVPIQKEFALSSATMGGLTSVALIAGAIGGIAFGRIADAIGRVRAMTISILVYSIATAGLATSQALWQLVAWRVLVGLGMGGEWSCGSVLVAETWPAEHRAKAIERLGPLDDRALDRLPGRAVDPAEYDVDMRVVNELGRRCGGSGKLSRRAGARCSRRCSCVAPSSPHFSRAACSSRTGA